MTTAYDISGSVRFAVNLSFNKTVDLNVIDNPVNISDRFSITFGSGANQYSQIYKKTVVLADGENSTLNLYDSGTLLDDYGNAVAISSLKLLYIKNNSADANLLVFGGNSADIPILSAATAKYIIPPGGLYPYISPLAAGLNITTNKNLRLEHDGTGTSTMNVTIIAAGRNAALE